jgi:hypothetical protein
MQETKPVVSSFGNVRATGARYRTDHRATRYRLTVFNMEGKVFLLVEPNGNGNGRWFRLPTDFGDIAWSYLAEKLDLRDGDREGWSALITAATGMRVFA